MSLYELISLGAFFVFWIVLMGYILPKMGIPTCMSGSCGLPPDYYKNKKSDVQKPETEQK